MVRSTYSCRLHAKEYTVAWAKGFIVIKDITRMLYIGNLIKCIRGYHGGILEPRDTTGSVISFQGPRVTALLSGSNLGDPTESASIHICGEIVSLIQQLNILRINILEMRYIQVGNLQFI